MEKFSLSRSIKAVNAMYECASLSMTKRIGLATARRYLILSKSGDTINGKKKG
jgi:hypothetical protein